MSQPPLISVCIPAYDMGGKGAAFLGASFEALCNQSFTDFEVVVADQDDSGEVAQLCADYASRLRLRCVNNHAGLRQSSANTNAAMRGATGKILKILFQDDVLCHADALMQVAKAFEAPDCRWLLMGSAVTRDGSTLDRPMVPRMTPNIHLGRNTVSSPSVVAIAADAGLMFDENLIWLMDVDFYKTCAQALGEPMILPDTLVANRLHDGQVSASVSPALRRRELQYVRKKFRASETLGTRIEYYRQTFKARR